ncbi:hypothetical protein ACTA71_010701 [Dictyostelium dimigraforme]
MKLYFLIVLIHLQILITFGQVFDQGRIISNDGLCLSVQNKSSIYPTFENCGSNEVNQIFNFNIGSDSLPTFESKNGTIVVFWRKIAAYVGPDKFSIKFTADNKMFIRNTLNGGCLYSPSYGQPIFINSTCGTDPNQLFTFQSTSSSQDKVTFNPNEIPMVSGRFLDSLGTNGPKSSYKGLNYNIGGYSLRLDDDCVLRVRSPGSILWQSGVSPSYCTSSAFIILQTDGNLCIYPHETNPDPVWCSGTSGNNGRYFTFIPPFSYGREFGMVITDAKYQMVWGRFGKTLFLDAAYVLIPGSYLDKLNPNKNTLYSNQFITNGRFVFLNHIIIWNTNKPTSSQVGPYSFKIQEDSNVCVKSSVATQDAIFCTGIQSNNARYVHIPLLDYSNDTYWGWVTYDTINVLSYAQFNVPSGLNEYSKKFSPSFVARSINFEMGGITNAHAYHIRDFKYGFPISGGFLAFSRLYNTVRRLGNDLGLPGEVMGFSYYTEWTDTSLIIMAKPILSYNCYEWLETPQKIKVKEIIVGPTLQYAVASVGYNSFFLLDDNGKMLYHFDI